MNVSRLFTLVTIYSYFLMFLTTAYDCSKVRTIATEECKALVRLFESTNGNTWKKKDGWLESSISSKHTDPCIWYGVTCKRNSWGWFLFPHEKRVTKLELPHNRLSGYVPSEMASLSSLTVLDLSWNRLAGSLPLSFYSLSRLSVLNLCGNQLSGPINFRVSDLTKLSKLYLCDNNFFGSIPLEISNLPKLTILNLWKNQLSGIIPVEIKALASIKILRLSDNQLSGTIPREISNLSNLTDFSLSKNQLSGSIPRELSHLSDLTTLDLSANKLSGTIPEELSKLKNLLNLRLSHNVLSGSIPRSFVRLKRLFEFSFSGTNICEPRFPAFQGWISNIHTVDRSYIYCDDSSPSQLPLHKVLIYSMLLLKVFVLLFIVLKYISKWVFTPQATKETPAIDSILSRSEHSDYGTISLSKEESE